MESSRTSSMASPLAPEASRAPEASSTGKRSTRSRTRRVRSTCLLTPLHPERSLSNALVQHLAQEMPDIQFYLSCESPDVIWVCGYEPGSEALIQSLRAQNPDSSIVVTGRDALVSWEDQVLAAGGDYCCGWPLPMNDLGQILRGA